MTRTMMDGGGGRQTSASASRIVRRECERPSGDVNDHHDTNAAAFTGKAERTTMTSTMTRRRSKAK